MPNRIPMRSPHSTARIALSFRVNDGPTHRCAAHVSTEDIDQMDGRTHTIRARHGPVPSIKWKSPARGSGGAIIWNRSRRRADAHANVREPDVNAELPDLERTVDEGLLIAVSAVRMAVKNDIIVGALREHDDYDAARYAADARSELRHLARQNEEYARRVSRMSKDLASMKWRLSLTDDQRHDLKQFALRLRVHERLALALDAVADDDDQVGRIVASAQRSASEEVSSAVSSKLIELAVDQREPDYAEHRNERLEAFVLINLAILKAKHEAETGEEYNEY